MLFFSFLFKINIPIVVKILILFFNLQFQRPWAQFDSNFQIMFKVGMGESPEIPDTLSEEGQNFVQHCLEHNPKERWLANELLQHHFCKVDFQDDASTENDESPKISTSKQ